MAAVEAGVGHFTGSIFCGINGYNALTPIVVIFRDLTANGAGFAVGVRAWDEFSKLVTGATYFNTETKGFFKYGLGAVLADYRQGNDGTRADGGVGDYGNGEQRTLHGGGTAGREDTFVLAHVKAGHQTAGDPLCADNSKIVAVDLHAQGGHGGLLQVQGDNGFLSRANKFSGKCGADVIACTCREAESCQQGKNDDCGCKNAFHV